MKHEAGLLITTEKGLKSLLGIVSPSTFEIDDIPVETDLWPKIDINNAPDYVTKITPNLSTEVEMTMDVEFNAGLIARLFGIDLAQESDFTVTMEYEYPVPVQARRHKKKRINKKWAKRYGYKHILKPAKLENCTITPNPNGEFTVKSPCLTHF